MTTVETHTKDIKIMMTMQQTHSHTKRAYYYFQFLFKFALFKLNEPFFFNVQCLSESDQIYFLPVLDNTRTNKLLVDILFSRIVYQFFHHF